ncbi:MAG: putative phosphopantothenoylcysteine decarboxylase [Planctomycetota bacterium]|jgi:phosphopantothenoylcysteine decarboxylase/phosphopantothenate--cysteine ligase
MYQGDPATLAAFQGRRVAVGVCAGIASYKVAGVVSTLAQAGAEVVVAMTPDATRFVAPLVFQSLSGRPVIVSPWESATPGDPQHIRLASGLDACLVAPCTMDMLSRLATGRCDDSVSLLVASIDRARTPVVLAPSMNETMWRQPATQRNLATLRDDGFQILAPGEGWQACRASGPGRLPEPDAIVESLAAVLAAR